MRSQSILIVEDDSSVVEVLRRILETEGYEVDVAETGRNAVEKSTAKAYDLALLDLRLPDMNGSEVLRVMRSRTPRTAVIILSGYPEPPHPATSSDLRADGYLVKPVDVEELLKTVRQKSLGQ
jgi:DNA-binding response OmpR family regulator